MILRLDDSMPVYSAGVSIPWKWSVVLFNYSFIQSSIQHMLLSTYYVPGPILGGEQMSLLYRDVALVQGCLSSCPALPNS